MNNDLHKMHHHPSLESKLNIAADKVIVDSMFLFSFFSFKIIDSKHILVDKEEYQKKCISGMIKYYENLHRDVGKCAASIDDLSEALKRFGELRKNVNKPDNSIFVITGRASGKTIWFLNRKIK